MIGLLLTSLIFAYRVVARTTPQGTTYRWIVRIPIVQFMARVSVASVVSAARLLTLLGFTGFGLPHAFWATVLIAVATLIGALITWTQREVAFAFVQIRAFSGIAAEQVDTTTIVIATAVAALILAVIATGRLATSSRLAASPAA